MARLHVYLLGKFCVRWDGQLLEGLDALKVQELFCYLLLHREQPSSREALAGLLWGDTSTVQSKAYLRKALWQLQSSVDTQTAENHSHLLLVEPEWIQLNPHADLWLDVVALEQSFMCAKGIPGSDLDDTRFQDLQRAVDLYRGDLLEGWYHTWCLSERERLQNMYLTMLDKLIGYYEAHGDYESGIDHGGRVLSYDRARECTHRQLMRLYYLAGDRTAALRQYDRCASILQEELGVRPARSTVELYKQIRIDQFHSPDASRRENASFTESVSPLLNTLDYLKRIQSVLADLQQQIQHDIRQVETILRSRH